MKQSPFQKFGSYLLTGLVVSAPAGITILLFGWAFLKLDSILGGIFKLWLGVRIPGIGFLALVLIVLFIGAITRSYAGKKFIKLTDATFTKLPIARTIYLSVKQLQTLLEIRKRVLFHKAVLIEYPRKGLYSIGFLMSEHSINFSGKQFFPIFISTTPNPTSGFLLFVEQEQFAPLHISTEEAIKLVISAGIIQPESPAGKVQQPDSYSSDEGDGEK